MDIKLAVFILALSLLLLHEMDAIRTKEWRMFVILKDMAEESAYRVFLLAHLPLYFVALYAIAIGDAAVNFIIYCIVDGFLILHGLIHFGFRHHRNNGFSSGVSKAIIGLASVVAAVHLCLVLIQ